MKAGVKVSKVSAKGTGLDEIFNSALTDQKVPLHLTWPRFVEMRKIINQITSNLELLRDCALMKHFSTESLSDYITEIHFEMKSANEMDLSEYECDWSLIEDELHSQFDSIYKWVKCSVSVRKLFKSLEQVAEYRKEFLAEGKTAEQTLFFIHNIPGADWSPLPFALNLKSVLLLPGIGKTTYEFLLNFLRNFYEQVKLLWQKTQEPDIDVEKFSETIAEAVDKLQKVPQLHRCTNAFKKIRESMGMFKENFSSYYRNFIDTKDQTSIVHEFIMDVSKTTNGSPQLTREFRTIVSYYQDLSKQQGPDPKRDAIMNKLMSTFKEAEKGVDGDKLRTMMREDIIQNNAEEKVTKVKKGPEQSERKDDDRDIDDLVAGIMDDKPTPAGAKKAAKPASAKPAPKQSAKQPPKQPAKKAAAKSGIERAAAAACPED